jgi:Mn2+/Fe2+ NRAMP family transporter
LQAAVIEKGIKVKEYAFSRWDVIAGCIVTSVVAFFIIVACGATIHASGGREIRDAADAALALRPLAGHAASVLFAFGLSNAALLSACILPLSTAFCVCEGFGLESGVSKRMHEAPAFYWLYTGMIVVSSLVVMLLSEAKQIPLILLTQVANGILLPFVLISMIRLSNRKDLMGNYRNTRLFNTVAWVTTVVMAGLTLLLVVSAFFPNRVPL